MISDEELKQLRSQKPPEELPAWTQEPATVPQIGYIKGLVESRDIPESWLLKIKEMTEAGLKKGDAGNIIKALKGRPLKPGADDRSKNKPTVGDIPPGRYAVQTGDENEIMFYRVVEATNRNTGNKYKIIKVIGGPNEYMITGARALSAAKMIVRAGIGNAAVLYGRKIGRCSQCNTRITNRLSRELGIGPICGGRVYGDWEERVNTARLDLMRRGLDPQENIG